MAERTTVFTLSTGPVDAYPEVLAGISRPVRYDFDPLYLAEYERIVERARVALGTAAAPVILQGEPVLGLEAGAASLIAADDVVLNLASGVYGKGFGYWAARYAKEVTEIAVPYNEAISPETVRTKLAERPDVTIVSVCHHDTPSGTLNPIDEIGAVVAEHGALLIVDAVSSWGGMPTSPDACHAALYITGPNKCLGGTPGLTILAVSEAAWEKMAANPAAPRASILSILDWKDAHKADRPFPFTPSVAEMNGLDAALALYLEEGPEKVWARHALTAAACRAGIKAMGLSLWAAREAIASPTCTAVAVPDGVSADALLTEAQMRYGVVFSKGRKETDGKLVRIGHMGTTARPLYATLAVTAFGGALNALGHTVDVGAGVAAALSVIDAAP
ncbi:pyridoxamine--pyruvate transaminase [Acuticoccus mangrovi]|uniref:Alanine--glyoxylate aminotransferase family protein n=1 Tax=Acuticoccus mangrovi TaxID=2796142 RepID=A0A934IM72_9HYPH|nr:alanine--glyoxylate aminotransferase family protein [Acuticoccus mangrovi]MBJ3774923.1 alanine--glyoxylate aminotransferase family protein [Acuticoccus mangrovi]